MFPYFLMLGAAGLAAIAPVTRSRAITLAALVSLVVFIGWRHQVGMDWNNYDSIVALTRYRDFRDLVEVAEPGFGLLLWIARETGGGVTLINVTSALMFCLGLVAFCRRCREPFLALVVAMPYLVVAVAMSAVRQSIALGLIFFLFATWEKRTVLSRTAIVLLATTFHFSALLMLVFVVLGSRLTLATRIITTIALTTVVFLIVGAAPEQVDFYTESYIAGPKTVESQGALYHVALVALPAVAYFGVRRRWWSVNGRSALMEQLGVAAMACLPGLLISSTATDRMSLYFWPFALYVCSGWPALVREKAVFRVAAVLASGALLWVWLSYANNSHAWLPYRNVIFDESR